MQLEALAISVWVVCIDITCKGGRCGFCIHCVRTCVFVCVCVSVCVHVCVQ